MFGFQRIACAHALQQFGRKAGYASHAQGFAFGQGVANAQLPMPETGEERFSSFLGIPIQRLGEKLGVLVVQSRDARSYTADELYALEVVAMRRIIRPCWLN